MTLQILVEPGPLGDGFSQALRAAAEATLQDQGVEEASVTVVLADETRMAAFNLEFAGESEPTDVLSFPDGKPDPDSGRIYLGDVIVCPPIAQTGAALGQHSLLDELTLLTVHGVLHLLNHDHDTEDGRARMWEAQARILSRLGSPVQLP
ncbi:MAG TPA: rRNA maturation RNase YbeY [Anaerolineales bacterium]|nr:rRNA maturation RNase YbeY [Anaerolineales bacterium]